MNIIQNINDKLYELFKSYDDVEAYVLGVATSVELAQSLGEDIIKEIQTRMEDGTLH